MVVTLGKIETIASMDVDAQNSFTPLCPDELPVPGGQDIVEGLNRQAKFASLRVGSKDAHSPDAFWVTNDPDKHPVGAPISNNPHPNADVYWPRHCVPGSKGFELIQGLPHPQEYDFFVWKGIEPNMHPYGACYHDLQQKMSTGLIEYLRAKGIQTVIVGGLATEFCVKATVLELLQAGFKVIVNQAACRGLQQQAATKAYHEMQKQGAQLIQSTKELQYET